MQILFRALLLVLTAAVLSGAQPPQAAPQQKKDPLPDKFMNLKVLPQDIKKEDLVNTMKSFTQSLGVRCNFCHAGQGDDLSTYDFMSDEKEHKQVARQMLQMVRDINQNHLAKVVEGDKKPPQVTCWTCHRGDEHVEMTMPKPKAKPAAAEGGKKQ